ncbi:SDR family NAD(P)-dependent oxidoreductase [Pseudonocardia sp. DSM 110487]|uniref:SDR family NAD(P)-dependent oxidoreductase n=1 Tax=Pseudonocardia sp. DSM 110487 TaxID=2865833 RepID=UPI001C6A03F6|nr:SDR family NAD(P)-dependent oxidoreductase [Pseudonocardia sp. DSM 110487]QYN34973.1 SDR family NAD(P)-dependent oxidoreductase [Pseudonocardia sp. DSM 110487]
MTSTSRKVIAVLGAGPGLGMSMARRFGREGFAVAIVSRTDARHGGYRAELAADGIDSRSYAADVTDAEQVRDVLARIAAEFGEIDTVYYGPASASFGSGIVPLPEADAAAVRAPLDGLLLPAVGVVAAALPPMLRRGDGALFFGGGLSGLRPMPMLGNLAPAAAALRMYVLTLAAAVKEQGVFAATLTIGGLIERGDIHRMFLEQGTPLPTLDPDDIADKAWHMYVARDEAEAVFDVLTSVA